MEQKIRFGMVGGGRGSLIGPVHRMALALDGLAELSAGVFSSNPVRSKEFGPTIGVPSHRSYGTVGEMVSGENGLPSDERIDAVVICTPNSDHRDAIEACIDGGFHVVCDKPLTTSLEHAYAIQDKLRSSDLFFALTHNYTGYPMVKQARHLVQSGAIGRIHKVVVQYSQGWLSALLGNDAEASKPWRMDPTRAGQACTMADTGTHAENLVRYVTGLIIELLCADLSAFVPGNRLDDDGSVLVRYKGGARGVIVASQVATGEENGLKLSVYGDAAGLTWLQERPNYLEVTSVSGSHRVYSKGNDDLCEAAKNAGRLPPGHPDGFIEGFANLYREAIRAIATAKAGTVVSEQIDVPSIEDGVVGMQFINTVVVSASNKEKWTQWQT